jgi:GNAT superfamily N-acetyltransferase
MKMIWPDLERLGKARTLLQRGHYAELLDQISSRFLPAGNPLLYWDRFVIVALADADARPPRRRPDRAPVLATPADVEILGRERPDRAALVRRRLREGQRCFVIHEDGKIVARQWVVGDQPAYDTNSGLRFVPPSRPSLWCHDIFVDPAYRMRGYFVALMLNGLLRTPDQPAPHLYGEIHFLNHGSIRAHLSFGYRVIRTVTVVSVLGWKVYRIERADGPAALETRHAWRVRHI